MDAQSESTAASIIVREGSVVTSLLLEAFLAFRVPHQTGDLYKQLDSIDHDNAAKTRILRFLHAFSHLDQIADPEHNPSMLAETPSVLRDLFALIEHSDAAHFKSMNDLVASV
jgi:wobble nucleotide-excising tRNase